MKDVQIGNVTVSNNRPLSVIAGPCQLESRDHAMMIATEMARACDQAGARFIFKASYDKANRTSLRGVRGLGIEAGLRILQEVRKEIGCPVLTDIHDAQQARIAGSVVDVIQIPAFLCRQTDLLLAAGETGCVVNIKKGQFLAPWGHAECCRESCLDRQRENPADRARHILRIQHAGRRHARPARDDEKPATR